MRPGPLQRGSLACYRGASHPDFAAKPPSDGAGRPLVAVLRMKLKPLVLTVNCTYSTHEL